MVSASVRAYTGFCIFRILNALLLQTQFDPDEYWQNLEPAYCYVFAGESSSLFEEGPCPGLTWEWTRRPPSLKINSFDDFIASGLEGPVRSYASILPTLLFYQTIKFLSLDSTWMVSKGPILLNAIIVAAPTDWAVWYIARFMQSQEENLKSSVVWWCSFCSLISWFNAYCLIRTYSNSLETMLLSVSLSLVGMKLFGDKISETSQRYRDCLAFFLGGISCSIRFTSVAAYIPLGILLSFHEKSLKAGMTYLFGVCALFGSLGIAATLILDRFIYGFWAVPILGNIHFNVILGYGSLYGTHPFHWYVTAGIPAITGLLLPLLVLDLFKGWNANKMILWLLCSFYALAHSFSKHKEFRFLLPILPIFCLLSGPRLRDVITSRRDGKSWLIVGCSLNLLVFMYLGLFHQRAPIDVNRRIVDLVRHEPQTYTIHYLMGCHSTPLLSHLHNPPIRFQTWTLDCSPNCRSNPQITCESEAFLENPGKFMEDAYFHCEDVEEGTCVTDSRIFYPDFLVASACDLPSMKSRIETMGMKEVGRFVNGIKAVGLAGRLTLGDAGFARGPSVTKLSFLFDNLVLSFDEFVLYENKEINPRF